MLTWIPTAADAAQSASACFAIAGARSRTEVERARLDYAKLPVSDFTRATDVKRLSLLRITDQSAREWILSPPRGCDLNTLNSSMSDPAIKSLVGFLVETDRWDQAALHQILDRIGWPTISGYGVEADRTAFLIVQHALNDPPWQRSILARLEKLLGRRETSGENYALLFDRVQVAAGLPQTFGSQGECHGASWEPDPIEDAANVDKRRATLGMPGMSEYRRTVSSTYCHH